MATRIGSIIVTETEVITPSGRIPLAQANFGFINQTMLVRKTPQWAIVMAIVGFFVLTFFSIGVLSDFRKLWDEGLAKLVAVYVVTLFGFVVWVGLFISWIFFAGVRPPLVG